MPCPCVCRRENQWKIVGLSLACHREQLSQLFRVHESTARTSSASAFSICFTSRAILGTVFLSTVRPRQRANTLGEVKTTRCELTMLIFRRV